MLSTPAKAIVEQPTSTLQNRIVAALCVLMSLQAIALAIWGDAIVGEVDTYVPFVMGAVILTYALSAVFLFVHSVETRLRRLFVAGCGFLFCAMMMVPYLAVYPRVFGTDVSLPTQQVAAGLWFVWHGLFPLFMIAAILSIHRNFVPTWKLVGLSIAVEAVATVAIVAALWATRFSLPEMTTLGGYTLFSKRFLEPLLFGLDLTALAVLWRGLGFGTSLSQGLGFATLASFIDALLVLECPRWSIGWYAGKTFALGSSAALLGFFIIEFAGLQRELRKTFEDLADSQARELERAIETSRLKGEFVAVMSHEIRTPLNGVVGATELLLKEHLTKDQRELAAMIGDASQALMGVVNDVLDFSKIESGKLQVEMTTFDPVSVVEGVGAILGAQARNKSLSLMTYVDPAIPSPVVGDPTRLRQVLVNLVGNAIKFTSQGFVLLSAELRGQGIHYAVRDTGIGITPEQLRKLFEPFVQADGSTTRRFGGTGLGLAICKRLVAAMSGGEIAVDSVAGEGTTFSFTLPLIAAPDSKTTEHDLHELRVLIVGSDPNARDVLARYVASWGVRLANAEGTAEALRLVREAAGDNRFDVAIVDLSTDAASAKAMLSDPAFESTRAIAVIAGPERIKAAKHAGFSAYLQKPIRQSQLFDALADSGLIAAPEEESSSGDAVALRRVLLVDDNATNREIGKRQLAGLGCEVTLAVDGVEAVTLAREGTFDLILMDCMMPNLDGYGATRQIRHDQTRTGIHTPIFGLTANAFAEDRQACLAAGMDEVLVKPLAIAELRRAIGEEIAIGRAAAPPATLAIDEAHLREIFEDDREGTAEFLKGTLSEFEDLLTKTVAADADAAHTLKGAAANAGARELSQSAERFMNELRAGKPGDAQDLRAAFLRYSSAVAEFDSAAPGVKS